jgi:hypothetical protein
MDKSLIWRQIPDDDGQLCHQANLPNLLANSGIVPSNLQLKGFSNLPAELRVCIWEQVPTTTAFSSFIRVAGQTSGLVRGIHQPKISILSLKAGKRLSAKIVTALGNAYLRQLLGACDDADAENTFTIPGEVTSVEYVAKFHGLCGMRLKGQGWESNWFGDIPDSGYNQYGRIQGALESLTCEYNVHSATSLPWCCLTNDRRA